ncbi:MAG TPA: hypothetical protein VH640_26240 [Bryobacteraceae bacterium]|jgi:hypothetical protein
MKTLFTVGLCGIALALAAGYVGAQELRGVHFGGLINDYSPSTVSGGPYEIRGQWSLDINRSGTASFTADLNMETSDYGISGATQVDPANPATRSPHTHHITVTNGAVSYDMSVCPANNPATNSQGVVVTGTATTTGNGGPAPFESKGASTLQACITGGSQVQFSNLTLVYTGPATSHFGAQPIHGVVNQISTR